MPAAYAQVVVTPDSTVVCPGDCATLNASVPVGTGITFSSVDDIYSAVVPIGFTFNFYGVDYTQCVISANGHINFNISNAGQYAAWPISSGVPGNTDVYNSIMGFFADIDPGVGGTLQYATVGVAPNRRFVVSFCDVPMFSVTCNNLLASFQMILHESTNLIDLSISNAPICPSWNGGYSIQGVQNADGTVGTTTPGRNYPTIWTASHDTWQYAPGGGGASYTASEIPYYIVPISTPNIDWYTNGTTYLSSGNSVTVCPTVNTFYVAQAYSCADTTFDTSYVMIGGGPTIAVSSFTNPTTCGGADGSITFTGMAPNTAYTLHVTKDGVAQPVLPVTSNAAGTVVYNNLTAGVYSNLQIFLGGCTSNTVGPVTLTDPPLTADFGYTVHYGCDADTVVFTNLSATPGAITYDWDFGDGGNGDITTSPTHIYYGHASYFVLLTATNGVCTDTQQVVIDLSHPLDAAFSATNDSICQNTPITFTNASVISVHNGIIPTYHWDFGDGTTDDVAVNPTHTYTNAGVYTVTLSVTDFVPCTDTAQLTIVVDSIAGLSFVLTDSLFCEGQSAGFSATIVDQGLTGYTWDFGDGTVIPNTNPISHAYDTNGVFTVTLNTNYRLCPDISIANEVSVLPYPHINLGMDTSMCPGDAPYPVVDYINAGNPAAYYVWSTGDSGAVSGIIATAPGTYSATVTIGGCAAADTMEIRNDCYLGKPNVFTPDGDGLNDYWLPRQLLGESLASFTLTIYNRWGQLVYQTATLNGRGWDGKMNDVAQPQGVYVYMLEASFRNGRKEKLSGNVTLLR